MSTDEAEETLLETFFGSYTPHVLALIGIIAMLITACVYATTPKDAVECFVDYSVRNCRGTGCKHPEVCTARPAK